MNPNIMVVVDAGVAAASYQGTEGYILSEISAALPMLMKAIEAAQLEPHIFKVTVTAQSK